MRTLDPGDERDHPAARQRRQRIAQRVANQVGQRIGPGRRLRIRPLPGLTRTEMG